jgi:uncharacterized protein (DUF2147 family)
MKLRSLLCSGLVVFCWFYTVGLSLADPIGNWQLPDEPAIVRIEACGSDLLCGYIASGIDPAAKDFHNPDPRKRKNPLLGTEVLIDLKHAKDAWEGKSYDADSGQILSAKVTQKSDSSIEVQGCAPGGSQCGTQIWSRVKP